MKYYPIFMRLEGRPCAVLGGGEVAERKVEGLLDAEARVTVISPSLTGELERLARDGRIEHVAREYCRGDLRPFCLAFAATDDETVNAEATQEAAETGTLLNVVDRPARCSFISPAVVQRGEMMIAVSTSGASPLLSRRIRERLEAEFGPEYADLLRLLRAVRHRLAASGLRGEKRRRLLSAVIDSPVLAHVRERNWAAVNRLLVDTVGPDCTLENIGLAD